MKTRSFFESLLLIVGLLFILPSDLMAQGPPPWAPAHGYRAKTRHVYFPEHNFYFDVQRGVYIYLNGSSWAVSASLPSAYSSLNLRVARQVELELSTDKPQRYNADHKVKYKSNQGGGKKNSPTGGKPKSQGGGKKGKGN